MSVRAADNSSSARGPLLAAVALGVLAFAAWSYSGQLVCIAGSVWQFAATSLALLSGSAAVLLSCRAVRVWRWQRRWRGNWPYLAECPACRSYQVDERGVCHDCGCALLAPPPLPPEVVRQHWWRAFGRILSGAAMGLLTVLPLSEGQQLVLSWVAVAQAALGVVGLARLGDRVRRSR